MVALTVSIFAPTAHSVSIVECLFLNFVIVNSTWATVFALLTIFVKGESVVIKPHVIRIYIFEAFGRFSF